MAQRKGIPLLKLSQKIHKSPLALSGDRDYILRMETQEKIVRIGNALYGEVNGMIVRFIGMVS